MPSDDLRENKLGKMLDAAGIPWRVSRSDLAARYGVRRHAAYDWDVIEIDTAPPIVAGLLWPLSAQVLPQFSPHLPATQFTGLVRASDDAPTRMALIFHGAQLYLIPVEDIVGFHVARMLPAKGAGGSRLEVECRTRCVGLETKRLTITESQGTEDLNALAAGLASETARPFRLGDYAYDA